jgi:hypothetical protein
MFSIGEFARHGRVPVRVTMTELGGLGARFGENGERWGSRLG